MKKARILAFVVTLCMATTCFLSGTVAKYSSSAEGSDSATVAKWSFKVGEGDSATDIAPSATNEFTFNLFDTINDTKKNAESESETDYTEKDVAEKKIAPGTQGSFDIVLTNASEVTAEYKVELTEIKNDSKIPVQFSLDGTTWYDSVDDASNSKTDTLAIADDTNNNDTATVTVYWKWAFEDSSDTDYDTNDTKLGVAAAEATDEDSAPTITVTAKVTATQVD